MKTILARFITLGALFSLIAISGRADAATHAQIIKDRDAILSEIVAYHESHFATGMADGEAVISAQNTLNAFRRDTAATIQEKLKQQELIVQAHEKRLATVKVRVKTGVGTRLELLTATDALLEARQLSEELKLSEKQI